MKDLDKILKFYKLLNKFREIERMNLSSRGDRKENDAEHSYQLAMLAWYIITIKNLNLNLEKVLKYCLAHDIVETYAGDTYVYTNNNSFKESKKKREEEALKKLQSEFKEFPELFDYVEGYQEKKKEKQGLCMH